MARIATASGRSRRRRRCAGPSPDRIAPAARPGPAVARRGRAGPPRSGGPRCRGRRAGSRPPGGAAAALARRSKPFCGSSLPIIPRTGPSSVGSKPIRFSRSARRGGLAAQVLGGVGRRKVAIGRRVPNLRVESIEDAEVAVALRPQRPVEPEAQRRRQRFAGIARADGVDHLGSSMPDAQEVDADSVLPRRCRRPAPAPAGRATRAASSRDTRGCAASAPRPRGRARGRPRTSDRGRSAAGPACQSWIWITSTGRSLSARSVSSAARLRSPNRHALSAKSPPPGGPYSPSRSKAAGWSTRRSR